LPPVADGQRSFVSVVPLPTKDLWLMRLRLQHLSSILVRLDRA
jgi:hypothetical protein